MKTRTPQQGPQQGPQMPPGMMPPGTSPGAHSLAESEWELAGAVARGGATAVAEARRYLSADGGDFGNQDLGAVFRHLCRLTDSGVARITPSQLRASLAAEFGAPGSPFLPASPSSAPPSALAAADAVNGAVRVLVEDVFRAAATTANVEWHARRVAGAAFERRSREGLAGLVARIDAGAIEPERLASEMIRLTDALLPGGAIGGAFASGVATRRSVTLADALPAFWERFRENYKDPQKLIGLDTGFGSVNRYIRGLRRGRLHIVAGQSGEGKSAFAKDLVANSSRLTGAAWHVQSYEMEHEELIERMVFSEAQVDSQRYLDGTLTDGEWRLLEAAYARLVTYPVTINDDANLTMSEVAGLARRAKRQGACDALLIDYAQLVPADVAPEDPEEEWFPSAAQRRRYPRARRAAAENRQREVSEIVKAGKRLAVELSIPVVMLSQLNDQGLMRESRDVKNHADVVLILERMEDPEEARARAKAANETVPEIAYKLHVNKCRGGRVGSVPLKFRDSLTRFDEAFGDDW